MLPIIPDFNLLPLNTFHIMALAVCYSQINSEEELLCIKDNINYAKGVFILGGGSNILFTQNIDRWVLHNKIKGIEQIREDESHVWIKVGAGEIWHEFVLYCIKHNLAGVENLSLIPGTVGAAPMQNIGAYGVEVKEVIDEVYFFDFETATFQTLNNENCHFGYRNSIFKEKLKNKVMITSVIFKLNKQPQFKVNYGTIQQELAAEGITELSIQNISDAVIRIRSLKLPDPKVIGNAGSFFKNPEIENAHYNLLKEKFPAIPGYKVSDEMIKVPAGWLIEQCGWKGFRKDDYGVHKDQALVLVNYADALGEDIFNLSTDILSSVKEKFEIDLQREVQIV